MFTSLFLAGCFTIPGRDRVVVIDSCINKQGVTANHPYQHPIAYDTYIPAVDQSLRAKVHYIDQCMINYSHGQGWNNRTDFQN